jgi:thiopeptide-type bacteriocin biosynthesis protein
MIKRKLYPGTECFYLKIYCGVIRADEILKNCLPIMLDYLYDKKIIYNWFFIRYKDEDEHLRIRLFLNDITDYSKVFDIFHHTFSAYIEDRSIFNIQLDTYNREIERYGTSTILLAEEIFNIDSEICLHTIRNYSDDERWKIATYIMNSYLNSFFEADQERIFFVKSMVDSYASEFNFKKNQRLQLDKMYRHKRKDIESILNENSSYIVNDQMLVNYIERLPAVIKRILEIHSKSSKSVLWGIYSSLIHMSINRIFVSSQRLQEFVLYTYIHKEMKSIQARKKYMATT